MASYQPVLLFFQYICPKYCACHEKVRPGHAKCYAPVKQNHLSKPEDLMLQNAISLSGNQRPDLLVSLMNMSLVLRLPRDMRLCRCSSNFPPLPSFLEMLQSFCTLTNCSLLARCTIPCACQAQRHQNVQKWSEAASFSHFWLGNASRHNGMHFCDISTSTPDPNIECLVAL